MPQSTSRVGKRGTVVIPAALRRRFGIEEGSLVIAEDREEGIEDYARAKEEVRKMGLDPDTIPHRRRP